MRAGFAEVDITPPLGTAKIGWLKEIIPKAVADPLFARAAVFECGGQQIGFIQLDTLSVRWSTVEEVRRRITDRFGFPGERIMVSATHTHGGPAVANCGDVKRDEGYLAFLLESMVEAFGQALGAAAEAEICLGRTVDFAIGHNRRLIMRDGTVCTHGTFANPDALCFEGPIDPEVVVLAARDTAGQMLGCLVNYACHPITVGPDCDLITPDYPGVMKRVVEQSTGAVCLFLQGAAGDLGPIQGVARGGLAEYRRLGSILGHEVSRIWWELEPRRRRDRYAGTLESGSPLAIYEDETLPDLDATLRVGVREVQLPLKQFAPAAELGAAAARHIERLNRLRVEGGDLEAIRTETMLAKRAGMRAELARRNEGHTHRSVIVQTFTIGDQIALPAVPGEPFCEIGRRVKAGSPFPYTLFAGYANIGWAYIPTADAYPSGGYEIEITPFAPEAADRLVDAVLALLHEQASELHR